MTKDGSLPLLRAIGSGGRFADLVVEYLIKSGADVNKASSKGMTPLMQAARFGTPYIVDKLLENGANPMTQDARGKTAIDYSRARAKYCTNQHDKIERKINSFTQAAPAKQATGTRSAQ